MQTELILEKLTNWHAGGRDPVNLTIALATWEVRIAAHQSEAIGARVWEIQASSKSGPDRLKTALEWAKAIVGRVSSLPEKLCLVETDPLSRQALLRSAAGERAGDESTRYFEVRLTGTTEMRLKRYEAQQDHGQPRKQISFAITHEALAKLITDLLPE
jgi:hypothetical protein